MLEVLRFVADDAGCFGNWSLAVGAIRLRGRRSYQGPETWMRFGDISGYEILARATFTCTPTGGARCDWSATGAAIRRAELGTVR